MGFLEDAWNFLTAKPPEENKYLGLNNEATTPNNGSLIPTVASALIPTVASAVASRSAEAPAPSSEGDTSTTTTTTTTTPPNYWGGGSGYWLGGSGGGYGTGANNETMAKIIRPLTQAGMKLINDDADRRIEILENNIGENERIAKDNLVDVIQSSSADRFAQYQKEQAALRQNLNSLGSGASGSIINAIQSGVARANDMYDTATLNAINEQSGEINRQLQSAIADDINKINDLNADRTQNFTKSYLDYLTQLANLNPDYLTEYDHWIDILKGAEDPEEQMAVILDINEDNGLNLPDWLKDMSYEYAARTYPDHLNSGKPTAWRPNMSAYTANQEPHRGTGNTASSANREYYRALGSDYANRKVE